MAITLVGANTNFTTTTQTPTVTVPSGVLNGDLLIAIMVYASQDIGITPPPGWTVVENATHLTGNGEVCVCYRTMAAGVTSASWTLDTSASYAKSSSAMVAYRGAGAPVFGADFIRTALDTQTTAPGITTSAANSKIVGLFMDRVSSQTAAVAPSGMTEQAKYVSGGGGGCSVLIADESRPTAGATGSRTATYGVASSAAYGVLVGLAPLSNQPPTVSAGNNQTVSVNKPVTLSGSASDPDGSIASVAWTQLSGPTVSLSNPGVVAPTFTPTLAGAYTFRLTATDDSGSSASAETTVYVNSTTATPIGTASNPGGYTNQGTALTLEEALADASDLTFIESPDAPAGAAYTCKMSPLEPGKVTVTVRARVSADTPAVTLTTNLMQGATQIASWTDSPTTSWADYAHTTDDTQAGQITNFNDLRVTVVGA